ncbi:MAG: DUF4252 domain-containing protein [Pseudomonadota bacterium]
MNRFLTVAIVILLLCSNALMAQNRLAGQVDLVPVQDAIGATPEVNLNFGNAILQGFAEGFRGSNDTLADLLGSVAGLRVMVYEEVDNQSLLPLYNETLSQLAFDGWTPALEIRDNTDQVDVYIKETADIVEGLMIMVNEQDGGAVFVNIFGAMDPVFIGQAISGGLDFSDLDLDQLGDLMNDNG